MKLIIAEKPSVAKAIAEAISSSSTEKLKKEGSNYIFNTCIITAAQGHLLENKHFAVANGLTIKSSWKQIYEKLPYAFPSEDLSTNYEVKKSASKAFYNITNTLKNNNITCIINACDPDAEGEGIFRLIIESKDLKKHISSKKIEIKRIWLNDMESATIIQELKNLKNSSDYEGLRQRFYLRNITDYTLSMNAGNALTVKRGTLSTVGRVQTPTLKIIMDRYLENKNHVEIKTWNAEIQVKDLGILKCEKLSFETPELANAYTLPSYGLLSLKTAKKSEKPPKLHNLSTLQQIMNKKHSISASDTLACVQFLYENKACSYPRTDCQFITDETAKSINFSLFNKTINDLRVDNVVGPTTAHYGLIILNKCPEAASENQKKVYEEIYGTLHANMYPNIEYDQYSYSYDNKGDVFNLKINVITKASFIDVYKPKTKFAEPSTIDVNVKQPFIKLVTESISKPKPLFTEATILKAMENPVGFDQHVDNVDNKQVYKEMDGIGTPATRANIIDGLFSKGYIEKKGKSLIPKAEGIELIEALMAINNPLVDIHFSIDLEKSLKLVEINHNLAEQIKQVNDIASSIVVNIQNSEFTKVKKQSNNTSNSSDEIAACPTCDGLLKESDSQYGKYYKCSECSFIIPGTFRNKKITAKIVKELINNKKTSKLKFKTKQKKEYEGYLILNEENKIEFTF